MDKSIGLRDQSNIGSSSVRPVDNSLKKPQPKIPDQPKSPDRTQAQQVSKKPAQIGKKMVPEQPRTAAMPRSSVNEQAAKEAFLKSNSKILKSLDSSEEDSLFEKALKKALTGKKNVDALPQGKEAEFKGKTKEGWKVFFKNLIKRSSKEKKQTYQRKDISKSTFRGAYSDENKRVVLVTDFHFKTDYERMVDKFVRLYVFNPKMVEKLKSIQPGSIIDDALLSSLGEEFEGTAVVHETLSYTDEEKKKMEKDLMTRLRRKVSAESRVKIEDQLIGARVPTPKKEISKSTRNSTQISNSRSFSLSKYLPVIAAILLIVGFFILFINM